MKKYLLWKANQQPAEASTPPHLLLPTVSAGLATGEEVAVSAMSPSVEGPTMCSPLLLDRLGPNILRSHISTAQYKSIPNNHGSSVDLEGFKGKEPGAWGMDDVIAWMIGVARKYSIPVEDLNMHRFANCSGPLLMLMSQQHFLDRDAVYGYLLYMEFRKLVGDDTNILDDWIKAYRTPDGLSPDSFNPGDPSSLPSSSRPTPPPHGLSAMLSSGALTSPPLRLVEPSADPYPPSYSHTPQHHSPSSSSSTPAPKLRRNKDGRPRKRSQHNKGNKLWEFIRDALKDPLTCPSVVRWEDPKEGVFRIVESERLARLWGERKNNTKMTYEKLSRAMRTYYEKQILVPVPKTGLYPKKLVYKFGPVVMGQEPRSTEDEPDSDLD